MVFDIVLVLHNSAKWLPNCLRALAAIQYTLSDLHLIMIDNASSDDIGPVLDSLEEMTQRLGSIRYEYRDKNAGFGIGCNQGAALGHSEFIFFLNVDTEISPTLFEKLEDAISSAAPEVAAFECRQLPFETGHHIDPVTLQTTWASAAALVVRRDAFEKVGGFDKHLFMYCEDVDLSWRLRAKGYLIQYVPSAEVWHYSYLQEPPREDAPSPASAQTKLGEYAGGLLGNLLLRYKYGSLADILRGYSLYLRTLHRPLHFTHVRRVLSVNFLQHLGKLWPFLFWRITHRQEFRAKPARFEGGFAPDRGLFPFSKPTCLPLVSVIVRTCGRPEVLRQTLKSLRHQTYHNIEVIVVEDGPSTSQEVVAKELAGMTYQYHATGENTGRSRTGNRGLSFTCGAYLNFLDDDDYFYPDHIELLVSELISHPEADLVTAASMAMEVVAKSLSPYTFEVHDIYRIEFGRMDNFLLCQHCLMPIQSVLFSRKLFEKYGGLNEDVDGNEDWSMWMKYFAYGRRINEDRVDIPRATSIFLVPANAQAAQKREMYYQQYEDQILDDDTIHFSSTPRQMRNYYEGFIGDLLHLRRLGKLDNFLDKQANRQKK